MNAFIAASTQWRVGVAGPTGLDYGVLQSIFRLTHVPRAEWPQVFDDLRAMEDAALEQMRLSQRGKKHG